MWILWLHIRNVKGIIWLVSNYRCAQKQLSNHFKVSMNHTGLIVISCRTPFPYSFLYYYYFFFFYRSSFWDSLKFEVQPLHSSAPHYRPLCPQRAPIGPSYCNQPSANQMKAFQVGCAKFQITADS